MTSNNKRPEPWQVPAPINEAHRLAALHAYKVLDTAPEQVFDDIARLASQICGTPVALTSLVDSDRQWFKARIGIASPQTPRDMAFCAHTILGTDVFIVEDAQQDTRFAGSPLVAGEPHVRFYAGAPLISPEGFGLGSLCVIDQKPRTLSALQRDSLEALARQTVAFLEQRRVMEKLAHALKAIKVLESLIPMCAWCKNVRSDEGYWHHVEEYIKQTSGADVSHGICPPCMDKMRAEPDPTQA